MDRQPRLRTSILAITLRNALIARAIKSSVILDLHLGEHYMEYTQVSWFPIVNNATLHTMKLSVILCNSKFYAIVVWTVHAKIFM